MCSEKHHEAFLFAYQGFSVSNVGKNESGKELDANVEISEEKNISINESTDNEASEEVCKVSPLTTEGSTDQKGEKEKENLDDENCLLKAAKLQLQTLPKPMSLFMLQGWREELCKCSDCKKKYQDLSLDFLLDPEDTVHHYENKYETRKSSQYEDGMNVLSKMDRTNQIEAIHGYNSMKSNLMEYLKKFAENKKVVRKEDIQEFFQQMSGNKKMKMDIPDNCK